MFRALFSAWVMLGPVVVVSTVHIASMCIRSKSPRLPLRTAHHRLRGQHTNTSTTQYANRTAVIDA